MESRTQYALATNGESDFIFPAFESLACIALADILYHIMTQVGPDGRPTGLEKISGQAVEAILGGLYRQYVSPSLQKHSSQQTTDIAHTKTGRCRRIASFQFADTSIPPITLRTPRASDTISAKAWRFIKFKTSKPRIVIVVN